MNIPFINDFLKRERKTKGITQEKFATMLFKSLPTIKRYDTGDIIPENVLHRSCEVLNIDFFTLLKAQEEESLGDFENWEEIDEYNKEVAKDYGTWTEEVEVLITPPYEKMLRKYQNELKKISLPQPMNAIKEYPQQIVNIKNNYNIKSLENELINYLKFKDSFLNIDTTEEMQKEKIKKIFSFIDFLYFQDIIKNNN